MLPRTKEHIRRILELRRSNAASPVPSKAKYNRKKKHKDRSEE